MLPQLAPIIAAAARGGIALIWKIVLVVEFLGRSNGIGFKIHLYFQLFDVAMVLVYALSFVAVMLLIEALAPPAVGGAGAALANRVSGLAVQIRRKAFGAHEVLRDIGFRSSPARRWRCSGRRASARPRCCGSSPGWTRPSRARWGGPSASPSCSRSRRCCPGAACSRT